MSAQPEPEQADPRGAGDPAESPPKRGGGPRTPEGKLRVSQNALKHGLTAKRLVVGTESEDECEAFIDDMVESLDAVGTAEVTAATTIAIGHWRKRRAPIFETRVLADAYERTIMPSSQASAQEELLNGLGCEVESAIYFLERLDHLDESVVIPHTTMTTNALYLVTVTCNMGKLPDEARPPGPSDYWSVGDVRRWMETVGRHMHISARLLQERAIRLGTDVLAARRRRRLAMETRGMELYFSRMSLYIEPLMRYESRIEREIDRAYKQLDMLQRRRRAGDQPRDGDED